MTGTHHVTCARRRRNGPQRERMNTRFWFQNCNEGGRWCEIHGKMRCECVMRVRGYDRVRGNRDTVVSGELCPCSPYGEMALRHGRGADVGGT